MPFHDGWIFTLPQTPILPKIFIKLCLIKSIILITALLFLARRGSNSIFKTVTSILFIVKTISPIFLRQEAAAVAQRKNREDWGTCKVTWTLWIRSHLYTALSSLQGGSN